MALDLKLTNPANPKQFTYLDSAGLAKDSPSDPAWLKAEKQRRRGAGKPPATRTAPVRLPAPAVRQGKSLPPLPEMTGLHPLQMDRRQVRAEFDALFDWVKAADAAPGRFTIRQEVQRDGIADRVDLLRLYAFA